MLGENPAVLRRARIADLGPVTEIADSSTRLPGMAPDPTGFLVPEYTRRDYREWLNRAEHFNVVCYDALVAGFLLAFSDTRAKLDPPIRQAIRSSWTKPFVLIKQVCVRSEYRRMHLGTLLDRDLKRVTAPSALFVSVVQEPENRASIAFHGKMGFMDFAHARGSDGILRQILAARIYG